MKKRAKKRSKTTQPRPQLPQLDIGELTQVYGASRMLDEGTKGGGIDHNQI